MKRALFSLIATFLFVATIQAAEPKQEAGTTKGSDDKSPWDFTFGPTEDGNFGTALKGGKWYPLRRATLSEQEKVKQSTSDFQLASPYVGVEIDGAWNSKPDALNNLSFSVKPSLALQRVFFTESPELGKTPNTRGPWLFAFLDGRQRFGHFKEGEEETAKEINQTFLGAGVEVRLTPVPFKYAESSLGKRTGVLEQPPSLSLTYYTVRNNGRDEGEVPKELTVDTLQAKVSAAFTIPFQCRTSSTAAAADPDDPFDEQPVVNIKCPWKVDLAYAASLPTKGDDTDLQHFGDFALIYETGGAMKPVIRLRTGKEHGLEYDRQIILGVLWNLLQP